MSSEMNVEPVIRAQAVAPVRIDAQGESARNAATARQATVAEAVPAAEADNPIEAAAKATRPGETESRERRREVTNNDVKQVAETLSRQLATLKDRGVRYHMHESGQMYVDIVDEETSEIIRSIPPEETLERLAKLEKYLGLLFDRKV